MSAEPNLFEPNVDPRFEPPAAYASFKFTVPGPLKAYWQSQAIDLEAARFKLFFDEQGPAVLQAIVALTPAGLDSLAAYVPLVASAREEDHSIYSFELKAELLQQYRREFSKAITPEDVLAVGQGVCLQLDNYAKAQTSRFE